MGAPPIPEWLPVLVFMGVVGGLLYLIHLCFELFELLVRGILWAWVRIREGRADRAAGSWETLADGSWAAGPCEVDGCRWPRGHRRTDHMIDRPAPDEELVW